ncbi:superoxide dismutase family protein [Georgenia sp. AZ-5]|uniref:superoxide dismutase family protein n=1 Tax=Georgenia sp. AZ-5 TaxID=3367526 RepID=UPI003754AD0E
MRRAAWTSAASVGVLLAMGGCAGDGTAAETEPAAGEAATPAGGEAGGGTGDGSGGVEPAVTGTFQDPDGNEVGTVEIGEDDGGTRLSVGVTGLTPGFHGLHVHAVGLCEPDSPNPTDPAQVGDFLSAGGHLGAADADHGAHAGDLPSLYVDASGTGTLEVATDAFTAEDLLDDDGSAVMVHANRDNFAHIPERYAPQGPDEQTRRTGDAGDRVACAVVEEE